MSKEAARHHREAALALGLAAKHHLAAAEHHEADRHEKAGHFAHVAEGHLNEARHHVEEASKLHAHAHGLADK
ncbi:MAG TPA: hypothetical protein VKI00_10295 [Mycobacterium sp.]|uniref:hypothetical protein n=1 Tax=Mycobacterium sp. TaxID=1785 RepID=UPI002BC77452|nr:hypothetical protein [Mycobacterium sp.]HME76018.1 hypothetical protein [Mycobacterium sp.]